MICYFSDTTRRTYARMELSRKTVRFSKQSFKIGAGVDFPNRATERGYKYFEKLRLKNLLVKLGRGRVPAWGCQTTTLFLALVYSYRM